MRDDSHRWAPPRPLSHTSAALSISEVALASMRYVSGRDVLARYADRLVAWPDIADCESYVLALRRDRVLCVGDCGAPLAGHAATDVSDGFTVLDISGPSALAALCSGAELRLDRPSRSVVRQVFGVAVMLYRFGDAGRFRVHVPRARAQAFAAQLIDSSKG